MTEALSYAVSPLAPISGSAIMPENLPFKAWVAGLLALGQNYPNPHNGETTVPFELSAAADVRLEILDLLGRKVAGVVRKGRSAGHQSIKLNLAGLGLPPGDYVYQLEAATRTTVYRQSKLMSTE
jgi:hypothetical protein